MWKIWLLLVAAIVAELIGTTSLKLSDGMSKLLPTASFVLTYALSFWLLSIVLKRMEVSVAYAVWAGAGTALMAVIGIVLFGESISPLKLVSIVLIVLGVIGLNLA
ncbi:multidrug efflux SMR transporter [Chitinimonas arctica]|uniref:Multidrug efflux SMR transporter n=2 Tax=Chitinimonas arctica TaxID=2594795 RepID=A0A516SM44_9NEIS|nr:multidrug efflux SMR transporter [Chitinimonas arctica]